VVHEAGLTGAALEDHRACAVGRAPPVGAVLLAFTTFVIGIRPDKQHASRRTALVHRVRYAPRVRVARTSAEISMALARCPYRLSDEAAALASTPERSRWRKGSSLYLSPESPA
jgi:hypothetical protein